MHGNSKRENREIPSVSSSSVAIPSAEERSANLSEGTADMNADGKSDESILPAKREEAQWKSSGKGQAYSVDSPQSIG